MPESFSILLVDGNNLINHLRQLETKFMGLFKVSSIVPLHLGCKPVSSSLSPEMQNIAKSFTFKYGKEEEDKIELRVLSKPEHNTQCPMENMLDKDRATFLEDMGSRSQKGRLQYCSLGEIFPITQGESKSVG